MPRVPKKEKKKSSSTPAETLRQSCCSVAVVVDAVLSLTFLSDRSFLYPAAPSVRRVMRTSREGDADARPVWRTEGDESSIQYQNTKKQKQTKHLVQFTWRKAQQV